MSLLTEIISFVKTIHDRSNISHVIWLILVGLNNPIGDFDDPRYFSDGDNRKIASESIRRNSFCPVDSVSGSI